MFNSSVIDVAIGLVFVFLLLSLVASAAKEGMEAIFKRRGKDLETGIKELLGADSDKFVAQLYDHGLINSLFKGKYDPNGKGNLPSYIPTKNFALALIDLRNKSLSGDANAASIVLPSNVKQAFDAFKITAGADAAKLQQNVEAWYNSSMDRVSGWYKRRSQWWLLIIGLVITVAVNADSISIAKRLSTDTTLREAVVAAAQNESKSPPPATVSNRTSSPADNEGQSGAQTSSPADNKDRNSVPRGDQTIRQIKTNLAVLDGVGLPLGWNESLKEWHAEMDKADKLTDEDTKASLKKDANWNFIYSHLAGWLLTALAISLGAPFWFDMLNKIMVVRSTVKPHEKSKEEGSKDPQKAAG